MLVEINDLKKHYKTKQADVKAVDGINLNITQGETYGLVGESGCGKSTVAKLLINLIDPTSGSIVFNDQEFSNLSKKELFKERKNIQMVFQDPYASLHPRMKVLDILTEPLDIYSMYTKKERRNKAIEMLERVGLSEKYSARYPHEFSGGQRQRISIARSLMLNPKLLILDEAVSALDVSIQSQILNLLKDLQKEFNLTYLFISHDLSVVNYLCDKVSVMYLGQIIEEGPVEQVFEDTSHPYTKALISSIPSTKLDNKQERIVLKGDLPSPANPPKGCRFHTRCPIAEEGCKNIPPYVEVSKSHFSRCHLIEKFKKEYE